METDPEEGGAVVSDWQRDGDNAGEFLVRLDIEHVPRELQARAISQHLRMIADSLEDFPTPESGQMRKQRLTNTAVAGHWSWTS